MKIDLVLMADWPALSWLAQFDTKTTGVRVMHGPKVETSEFWVCEAVWDGIYTDGDFDRTDIIFGSGVRVREKSVNFVSSGSTVDRIQYISLGDSHYVSNSLVALLAVTEAQIEPGYPRYHSDFASVINGLDCFTRFLETTKGQVNLVYFNNLVWDGREIRLADKPKADRDFSSFEKYHQFLNSSVERLSKNLMDKARRTPFSQLATLSSGYDSTTVAALVSRHGCKAAISFDYARGHYQDTGAEAARELGLELTVFERDKWQREEFSEVLFLAADGHGEDRYFLAAQEVLSDCAVFTGYHGDKVWDLDTEDKYIKETLVRGDASGLSLAEYRLSVGFLNCPIPFLGARQIADIIRISRSEEMAPWDTGNGYTRPICRRIAESMSVKRASFGNQKKAASVLINTQRDFMTITALRDYLEWLRGNRWNIVKQGGLPIIVSERLDRFIYNCYLANEHFFVSVRALMAKIPGLWRFSNDSWLIDRCYLSQRIPPYYIRRFLFPWAIEQAKKSYPFSSVNATETVIQ